MLKNKILYTLALVAAFFLLAACTADVEPSPQQGWLCVEQPARDTTAAGTRAAEEEPDYLVSVLRNGTIAFAPTRYSAITGNIPLSAATNYTLIAESCSKTEAESQPTNYGKPRYAGTTDFAIAANERTTVKVQCSMANAAFQVVEDESFYYTDYTVYASLNDRTLTFTNDTQMGYFNVDEDTRTATLTYYVVATDAWGNPGTGSGTITLRAKTLSKLHLRGRDLGHLDVNVTYDDTFTPIVTEIIEIKP